MRFTRTQYEGITMRLTCSGISGDLGRTPGFKEPAWGGGVEGRSVGMADDLSQDAF